MDKKIRKPPREAVGFRVSKKVKNRLIESAKKQNIDPSDVYRQVFNAGLKVVYDFKIVGNELVE